jgi:hypothetical protein
LFCQTDKEASSETILKEPPKPTVSAGFAAAAIPEDSLASSDQTTF